MVGGLLVLWLLVQLGFAVRFVRCCLFLGSSFPLPGLFPSLYYSPFCIFISPFTLVCVRVFVKNGPEKCDS